MPTQPWRLDTLILSLTTRKADGSPGESRDLVLKAPLLDQGTVEFSDVRLIPTWTNVADVDTLAQDPGSGEKRLIKAGTRISYEDTPLSVDTVKPHELVEYERVRN